LPPWRRHSLTFHSISISIYLSIYICIDLSIYLSGEEEEEEEEEGEQEEEELPPWRLGNSAAAALANLSLDAPPPPRTTTMLLDDIPDDTAGETAAEPHPVRNSVIDSPCECEHNNPDSLDARLFSSVVLAVAPAVTMDEASSLSPATSPALSRCPAATK